MPNNKSSGNSRQGSVDTTRVRKSTPKKTVELALRKKVPSNLWRGGYNPNYPFGLTKTASRLLLKQECGVIIPKFKGDKRPLPESIKAKIKAAKQAHNELLREHGVNPKKQLNF